MLKAYLDHEKKRRWFRWLKPLTEQDAQRVLRDPWSIYRNPDLCHLTERRKVLAIGEAASEPLAEEVMLVSDSDYDLLKRSYDPWV